MTTVETPLAPLTIKKPSNILVMYQGGGYDGCSWEYNYALIDDDGDFVNIHSSGCFGCENHDDLLKRFDDKPDDFELFGLGREEDCQKFASTTPISHLLGVTRWLEDYGYSCSFPVTCDGCDNEVDATYCAGESLAGCGGIAMQYTEMICVDCRNLGTCSHCGEYVGSKDMADHKKTDSGRCKWCEVSQESEA
jgi:hypothetical protein